MIRKLQVLVLILIFAFSTRSARAVDPSDPAQTPLATAQLQGTLLAVQPTAAFEAAVVQVAGPNHYEARRVFAAGEPLAVDLYTDRTLEPADNDSGAEIGPATLPSGRYRWSLLLTDTEGRLRQIGGRFQLGAASLEEEGTPALESSSSGVADSEDDPPVEQNAVTHSDNVTIQDAANDSVVFLLLDADDANGIVIEQWKLENFFGDLRIVEFGGGAQQLVPMTIIDDADGEIGFGTTFPVQRLHMVGGNADGLRLEDGVASGLGAWDIQVLGDFGLEIEDVETGLDPIVIREGAVDNALYIDAFGRIGFNTDFPVGTLHAVDDNPALHLEESDELLARAHIRVETVDDRRVMEFRSLSSAAVPLSLDLDTGAVAFGGAFITTATGAHLSPGGEWVSASSRHLKENIRPLRSDLAAAALRALDPVEFNYRKEPEVGQVGFIAEDVPELVATPDRKGLASMDVVAVLTRVVQDQQRLIEELRDRVGRIEARD